MDRKREEKIELLQGDITKLNVDAIVNAANSSLIGEFSVKAEIPNSIPLEVGKHDLPC